jgi:D-aspartate ligase
MQPKGAIVIGGHINGLGLIRSLSALHIPTAVILTKPYDFAQHSRCVSGHESALEIAEKPEVLLEVLARRASLWKGWALFPANDEALASIVHNWRQIEPVHPILAPPGEVACYFLDKEIMLNAAQAVGILIPYCYGPAVPATADRSDLRFPVIVKPLAAYRFAELFGCKVFVATNLLELRQAIARIEKAGIPCQVYDVVPGPDSQIYCHCIYMDGRGNPRAELIIRKLRQSPAFFGVARVAEVVSESALPREADIEFLRRIRFQGIAVAEYKLDPRDGIFRLMEINGRSVIYNGLLRKAGMDLAALAWAAKTQCWPGTWINLHADLLYSALRSRDEGLHFGEYLKPYLRPKIEAVWSTHDPMPFLVQWKRALQALCGKWGLAPSHDANPHK